MTTWLDHPASDATDPQDGGEPFKYWWKDMRPAEVCELVKRVYERGRQSQTSALLDCYERAEDAENQLQTFFPELEHVVSDGVLDSLKAALQAVYHIQNIVTAALGGADELVDAQHKRETE